MSGSTEGAVGPLAPAGPAALGESTPKPAMASLLEGDCLQRLPQLAADGFRAELVYLDPPFNIRGSRRARVEPGQPRASGVFAYRDGYGSVDQFLDMLRPRLMALTPCLARRACVWLHLSHHAVHDAKCMADELWGRQAFQGEVIWVPGNGARRRSGPAVTHQTLLIYSPSGQYSWNPNSPALREAYAETSQRMHFRHQDDSGRRFRERTISGKSYRYYADAGRLRGSVWTDCPAMVANTPLRRETTGYPTQKPESLLERIILAASRPGGAILDPMCGSGTTLAVAARLGRPSVGIDQSPIACRIARERLERASALQERDGWPAT